MTSSDRRSRLSLIRRGDPARFVDRVGRHASAVAPRRAGPLAQRVVAGLAIAFVVVVVTGLGGCAAAGGRPPEDGVPTDLQLEVVLLEGRGRRLARTAEERPEPVIPAGRWIVLGDGSLHHLDRSERDETETGVHPSRRPAPRVRTLSAAETSDLWTLIVSTGLADSDRTGPPIAPVTIEADFDETVFVLAARAGGRRWSVVRRGVAPIDDLDPAAVALLERLAELTWIGERPGGRLVPRRYDLGDDPWQPYRDPAGPPVGSDQ